VVVGPQVGIERRGSGIPHCASCVLVGTRSRLYENLPIAASLFGVDRREDDADLADEVRINIGRRRENGITSCVRDAEAISDGIDCSYRQTRKGCVCVSGEALTKTRRDSHQVENVFFDHGKTNHALGGKHISDTWRRFGQQLQCGNGDFNLRRCRADFHREVPADLRGRTHSQFLHNRCIESGQIRSHPVAARWNNRKAVAAAFIGELCDRHACFGVGQRDRDSRNQSLGCILNDAAYLAVDGLGNTIVGGKKNSHQHCRENNSLHNPPRT